MTGDLSPLLGELSAIVIDLTEKDYICANLLLESSFDTVLSHNVDDLEAVRSYFSSKDSLRDFFTHYAQKLEAMKQDTSTTIDQARSFVLTMFKEIKENLMKGSKTHQLLNLNLQGVSGSIMAVNQSRVHAASELSHCRITQKSVDKEKDELVGSLNNANLSDLEIDSASKGWTSAHCSPTHSPPIDTAMTSRKKTKSRFVDLSRDAKVQAFHREWPLFHDSSSRKFESRPNLQELNLDVSSQENTRSPKFIKPSDLYQDNSPSMISLITKDDKKIIKNRVTTYDLLMKNAWYLKNYLRNLPLKKQEILNVIERFYFDDKDLQEAIGEHRLERNNTKTLHKIQKILEQSSKRENRSPKKINFNCKQSIEFFGFFDIINKDWTPILRYLYEKFDSRIHNLWEDFGKNRNFFDFGERLSLLAGKATEESKALSKKVRLE